MRVNPNPLPDLLSAVSQTQQEINRDLQQISCGTTINSPSDNPAGAAMLVRNAGQTAEADQFLRSSGNLAGELQNADSALSSVVSVLQRAIGLGTEGANGTLNSSNRAALAGEVQGIQSQLINLANLSYQGKYVFAGTATDTAPYIADSTSPSGVRYVGNTVVNSVTIGSNLAVNANMPGSQLFSGNGADMFQAVQDLVDSLRSGSNIDTAVSEVSTAYDHINAQRVFYGNSINRINSQQTFLNTETTQLAQQQNTIAGTDLAKVVSDLVSAQTSRQATLEAIAQTQQTNLFNYVK